MSRYGDKHLPNAYMHEWITLLTFVLFLNPMWFSVMCFWIMLILPILPDKVNGYCPFKCNSENLKCILGHWLALKNIYIDRLLCTLSGCVRMLMHDCSKIWHLTNFKRLQCLYSVVPRACSMNEIVEEGKPNYCCIDVEFPSASIKKQTLKHTIIHTYTHPLMTHCF